MKVIRYMDPYEKVPVIIQLEDDDAEGIEELVELLNEDARLTQNRERKERYHTPYHLEALDYEGTDYAVKRRIERRANSELISVETA